MFSVLSPGASAVPPPGGVARGKPGGWAGPPGKEPVPGGKLGVSLGVPGDELSRAKPEVGDGKEASPLRKPEGSAVLVGKDAPLPGKLGVPVLLENKSLPPETRGGSGGRAGNAPPRGKPVFSSGAAGAVGKEPSLRVAPGASVRMARKESVISQGGTPVLGSAPGVPAPGVPAPGVPAPDGPAPDGPAPDGPVPDGPASDGLAPAGPVPGDAVPAGPKPPGPKPAVPAPESGVPAAPALDGVAPAVPVPDRVGPVPGWAPGGCVVSAG